MRSLRASSPSTIADFIKEQGIGNYYSAENIIDENETLILGMVWSIILRFSVQDISEGDRTAKEGLLLWAQKKVAEGSNGTVKVTNCPPNIADAYSDSSPNDTITHTVCHCITKLY